jgi:hypothetical protein
MRSATSWRPPHSRHLAALVLTALPLHAAVCDTLLVPTDFATIQAAIDAADSSDTVVVEPGSYAENLELRANIDVRGRETARTLLSPDDDRDATVTIRNADGASFANFTLLESSTGIVVGTSSNVEISNIVFRGARNTAVTVEALASADVLNSVFFDNFRAIDRGSTNVQVDNNIFNGNEVTIVTRTSGIDPFANVSSNCFSANDDLRRGGVDTGVGASATVGDPLFVDAAKQDFHLREGSPCINVGRGTDVIDNSIADTGAYGGPLADARPFPVPRPQLTATGSPPTVGIAATWSPNMDYRVSNTTAPGGYRVHYKRGGNPGPPFDGTDAGGGTAPSPIDVGNTTMYTLADLQTGAAGTPAAPRLLSAAGRNQSVILTWEAVSGATGYRVRYGVNDLTESAVDAGNVTGFTVGGLTNGTTYRFAVAAINQPTYQVAITALDNTQNRNESAIVETSSIAIGAPLESPASSELTATPGPIEPYPTLPDEGCFIATAAYGADWAGEVQVLRDFRDEFLLTHAPGRWLVRLYYTHGPRAAEFLNDHESLKPAVRALLLPLVGAALVLLAGPSVAVTVTVAGLLTLIALRVRRRRSTAAAIAALLCLSATTDAQETAATFSPRWMYELKGGYFYPELDDYETFYGDDRDTLFAASGSYRLRDWIEVGAEIGYVRGEGVGILTGTGQPGGDVELRLMPVHLFVNFIYQPDPNRRFVPYVGIGVNAAAYEQDIELQPSREGTSDLGSAARAGVRWLITSEGPHSSAEQRPDSIYWRSYAFFEAQTSETKIDGVDLGGTLYLIGFRVELELDR